MLAFEWCGINQQRAELLLLQPPLHQFLQLGPARFYEMFADRALLQAVYFAELPHCLTIFPRAQTEHEFLPYRLRQRLPAMEHLVAAQPDLPIFGRTNSRRSTGTFCPITTQYPRSVPHRLAVRSGSGRLRSPTRCRTSSSISSSIICSPARRISSPTPSRNQPTISAIGSTICTVGFPSATISSSRFTARCDSI